MPDIQWQLSASENVSTAVQRIGQSLAGLDSSNAKTFGQMVQSLSNAQNAATRAATALQRLETAQAQTEAAQSRAASAALRLQQQTQQAASGIESMGRAAAQHGGAVSSFFSNALSAATGFLAANVFSRITGQIGGLVSGTVQAAASMEQTRAGFTSLLGSAQAADALIKQLQAEANVSPFSLESFRKASQLLLGMGVAAQDVVPRLHEVSNVVAAVGGGTEQFDRISLALAQIQAKGKLSAEEVNQLAESGVPAWDLLATALGKTKAQVIDLAQQGKISAETFNAAFAQFANSDQISQAAERNSHTFNGLLSTIGDIGQALETAFGTPVLQAVEPVLERIVSSLQDPAVITTLEQWGAAAGQFAVGLIQAGQTAFTVASQIIQALQPVTDFIGQLFGVAGVSAPTITPPDFTPAAQSAGQFGAAMQQGAANTKSAKDQVADLERQTRDLSRATAEANTGYDHRKQSLQDQLTLLDRQYQAENKAADIADLQAKIAKDRALAVDQYSSQGQAAASRLVDEEARLKQLQREQGHDAAKNAIEDRVKAIDREKQAYDEASAARTRQLQEQMDVLRANASAATSLAGALTAATRPAPPDRSKDPGSTPKGAAGGASVPLLDRIFGTPEQQLAAVNSFWSNLGTGLEKVLQGDSPTLQAGIDAWLKRTWEGGINIFRRTGQEDESMNLTRWILPIFGIDTTKSAPEIDAQIGTWIHDRVIGGLTAFVRTGKEDPDMNVTNWLFDALGLPRDHADVKTPPRARTGLGPEDTTPIAPPPNKKEPGHWIKVNGVDVWQTDLGATNGPAVTTTTSRNAPPVAQVEITFDENGVARAVQKHTSADRLLRVMGDAVR